MTVGVFTADDELLETALQWCAAAGVQPFVGHDASAAMRHWSASKTLIIGADVAPAVAAHLPQRRAGVIVIFSTNPPWEAAVTLGAQEVLSLTADPADVITHLQEVTDGSKAACIIGVIGACGGAGASTFSASLAHVAAAQGVRTLLIDADRFGGGLDLVLGAEHVAGIRWPDINPTAGHFTGTALRESLPVCGDFAFLSWGRQLSEAHNPETISAIIAAARRNNDLVVIDLDRSFIDDSFLAHCVLTLVIVPEEIRALAAAAVVLRKVSEQTTAAVITRNRNGSVANSTVESLLETPVIANLKNQKAIATAIDHGEGPWRSTPTRKAARAVLQTVGLVE